MAAQRRSVAGPLPRTPVQSRVLSASGISLASSGTACALSLGPCLATSIAMATAAPLLPCMQAVQEASTASMERGRRVARGPMAAKRRIPQREVHTASPSHISQDDSAQLLLPEGALQMLSAVTFPTHSICVAPSAAFLIRFRYAARAVSARARVGRGSCNWIPCFFLALWSSRELTAAHSSPQ